MKAIFTTASTLFFFLSLSLTAKTIYVKAGGAGNGAAWATASGDLASVLRTAVADDEIWVAKGTYFPTTGKDRRKMFCVLSGVKVFGGFAGTETHREQRNPFLHTTILSGDIGLRNDLADNAFTVVFIANANEQTVLDGFTISDGYANGVGAQADLDRSGGGLYLLGNNPQLNFKPVIRQCIFKDNYARDGGAAYVNGKGGRCNPIFEQCQFFNNSAEQDGGAIFNDGRLGGEASPEFLNCFFRENEGNYGAALCNYGGKGKSSPLLQDCIFTNNHALLKGGAIYNVNVNGSAVPVLNNCQFVENTATAGNNVAMFGGIEEPVKLVSGNEK